MLWVSGACFENNMIHPQVLLYIWRPACDFWPKLTAILPCRGRRGAGYCRPHQVGWSSEYTRELCRNQESRIRRRAKQSHPHLRSCSLGQCVLDACELDLTELEVSLAIASKRKSVAKRAMCPSALRACATNETIRAPAVGHHWVRLLEVLSLVKACCAF